MKKKFAALFLTCLMCLSLAACGDSGPDKEPAIDAFNSASTAFDEVANAVNADISSYPDELVDAMIEMSGLLTQYKELLESDQEFTEDDLNQMIEWFQSVQDWTDDAKTEYNID